MMNRAKIVKPLRKAGKVPKFIQTAHALAKFRSALRRFLSFSESVTAVFGVTSQHYQALLVLITAHGDGVRMKDLAEQMMLVPHGAVQLVDRLTEAGLVSRKTDQHDRRTVVVVPTPKAMEMMKMLVTAHARELQQQEGLLAEALAVVRRLE